jgi:hypothetical protein
VRVLFDTGHELFIPARYFIERALAYIRSAVLNGCRSVLRRRALVGHSSRQVRSRQMATLTGG